MLAEELLLLHFCRGHQQGCLPRHCWQLPTTMMFDQRQSPLQEVGLLLFCWGLSKLRQVLPMLLQRRAFCYDKVRICHTDIVHNGNDQPLPSFGYRSHNLAHHNATRRTLQSRWAAVPFPKMSKCGHVGTVRTASASGHVWHLKPRRCVSAVHCVVHHADVVVQLPQPTPHSVLWQALVAAAACPLGHSHGCAVPDCRPPIWLPMFLRRIDDTSVALAPDFPQLVLELHACQKRPPRKSRD
jgi:hypothetical protein